MENSVLITGAAGFIGSHLCEYFLEKGWSVVGLDNFLTGTRQNIAHLASLKKFSFFEHDITQFFSWQKPLSLVMHFACPASPADYIKYPIETMKVDSLGTFNTLELARTKKACFLFASTSEVYGDPEVHPQPETYWGNVNPIGPRSVYDEAKRFSEALTVAYHRTHQMDARIVRIFNTYGPRMRLYDGRVVPSFVHSALKNLPIPIHGDGSQTRSFCYVSDLVEGIFRLATYPDLHGQIVNLGNPEEYNMKQLAQIIKEITGSRSELMFKELPQDDPKKRKPDITKAIKLLNWSPNIAVRDGLRKTIEYFVKII